MNILSDHKPTALAYRPDIDGLRAIAILSVVIYHAFPTLIPGGFIGVDIFFVISGYLISSIILSDLSASKFSFLGFYGQRIRRIFPTLVLVMASALAVGWFTLFLDDYRYLGKHVTGGAGFVSNFMLAKESSYFDGDVTKKPFLHLWSLAIEEQFYLFWPLLLGLAWKRQWKLPLTLGLIIVASFTLNVAAIDKHATNTFYSPLSRFWELALGGLLASLHTKDQKLNLCWGRGHLQSGVGFLALVAGFALIDHGHGFPGYWALLPTLGALLIIAAGPGAYINRQLLSHPFMVWVGLISFPLYLWHWPLLAFPRLMAVEHFSVLAVCGAMVLAVILAQLSYSFLEKNMRFGEYKSAKTIGLLVAMSALGTGGYAIFANQGIPSRFPPEVQTLSPFTDFHWGQYVREGQCHIQDANSLSRDPSCFETARPLVALWGDSHASSFYPGLKKLQEDSHFGLTQLTQAGCGPIFDLEKLGYRKNCNEVNASVFSRLVQDQPDVLILDAAWLNGEYPLSLSELSEKLGATLDRIKSSLPKTHIVLLGPVPTWGAAPPKAIFLAWSKSHDDTLLRQDKQPADRHTATDALLKMLAETKNVAFISAADKLCQDSGCLARVGPEATDWVTIDYGHLSKAGAEFLAEQIKGDLTKVTGLSFR